MFDYYALAASFLGTSVELVEALTIVLAVGVIRGWKSALAGAASAVILLIALVILIGSPLTQIVQILWVQMMVGLFMLLFGIRWLRKAILRYAGLKSLHDEEKSYWEEIDRQQKHKVTVTGIDKFAFMTTFSGTFLEGIEAIFIVITFGLSSHAMNSSIAGAIAATLIVIMLGILLHKPLVKVPENTMKFIVGVMLTSFGAFWIGESFKVKWPQEDLSIIYITVTLCLFSWIVVFRIKKLLNPNLKVGLHENL